MSVVLTLLRKDIRLFLRNKTAFALTFIVPLVLVYIFGQVFGVSRSGSGPSGVPIAVVKQTDAPVADAIIAGLQAESAFKVLTQSVAADGSKSPLTEARVRKLIDDNQLRFALVFPPDTISDETFGLKLKFLNNPRNDIETQTVNGLLQKVIFTSAPQALMDGMRKRAVSYIGTAETDKFYDGMASTIAESFGLDVAEVRADMEAGVMDFGPTTDTNADGESESDAPTTAAADFISEIIKIENEQLAGADVKSPGATRVVGGWAIMFLLFSVSGASTSLFEEKQAGIFQRLLASPVRRSHVLWSKYLFNVLMGIVQLSVLFLAGQILFGIETTSHIPGLLTVALVASIACTAFGMLLAAISSSPAAASGLATFLILTMSAIGGAWFPTSLMPDFIQSISKLTLVYWSMEGFLAVLWAQKSIIEILPILGILLGIAAVVNVFSVWRFNKGDLFD
ncbi:ABC transporter permease [Synoicihabitans lomoniglobus]|uniref:ABC transporter permease n=1 Tax=Synoicihabitans lomoniglobus TaxID=2909285 RepID=A0AAF0CMU9_9BACT|nr:ABC transporter permease [Opitutaceae bacterium LMO-M01]WED63575.1 ABC transporter permease [Opitutaceae bacterium LMO-M01]